MKNNSRRATSSELLLISFLVEKANLHLNDNWQENLIVTPMDDGGMGSQVSECSFLDEDGVEVLATLNLDENSELFELDVWKVNYEPLIKLPYDDSAYKVLY